MEKLFNLGNGYKSYIGFIGMFILGGLAVVKPDVVEFGFYEMSMEFFKALAGIGIAHKLAKLMKHGD